MARPASAQKSKPDYSAPAGATYTAEEVAEQAAAFRKGGNRDVTARVVPNVNHFFVQDSDGFPGGYAKLAPPVTVRRDVVGMIADWLAPRLR